MKSPSGATEYSPATAIDLERVMAGKLPEEDLGWSVARQRWLFMTFLHWAYEPATVQALLPPDLEVDTHDGSAWVGLTPFLMGDFRPPFLPALPFVSTFPETNLRTYVRGPDGKDGLWFLTLEASNLATVLGARIGYGVPYHWADMACERGDRVRYRSRRRPARASAVGHDIAVVPGRALSEGELSAFDHFLTGRWRSYTRIFGRLFSVPVAHEPWPLWTAEVGDLHESLTEACGLQRPAAEPVVHYSPGVHDVRLGAPWPVARHHA
jgi:uncharacterized protein YqjF (DUF2071 family)